MSTMTESAKRYKIVVSGYRQQKMLRVGTGVAAAPRYVRERDEPLFNAAWSKIRILKASGEIKATPPAPEGGIRLRSRPSVVR